MGKKKAAARYGRKTISVPAGLEARMANHPEVNWSRIAVEAFERKLGELAAQKEILMKEDVIQRLRASKIEGGNEMERGAIEAGRKWAEKRATYAELKRLDRWWKGLSDRDRETVFSVASEYGNPSNAQTVAAAALGESENEIDREDVRQFWDYATGEDDARRDDDDFPPKFLEGALDVFDRIASQI